MPETTSCSGGDTIVDTTEVVDRTAFCPGCEHWVGTYRDSITGRDQCLRFVPHPRELAAPPAALARAILNEEAPDLERVLIGVESDLRTVASWIGTLTDADTLLALQLRLAAVANLADTIEHDALRLRRSAA